MINTVVYFLGNPDFGTLLNITLSLYDFLILIVTFLLFFFFFTSAIQTGLDLARKGE
jgi:hypothetical protein